MNIQNQNNQNNQMNGNNMMEMIKTQLMTFTMMKSMNGNNDKSGQDNGMLNMMYIFLLTAIIDFISKSVLPSAMQEFNKFYKSKINNNKLLKELTLKKTDTKSSSITIHINISDHENKIGQALLDFITNNNNTKHVTFKKQNFILNQTDVIEICDELFVKLSEITETDESSSNGAGIQQKIELFSYTKTTNELRVFLNKLSRDYEIKIKNKLGDNIYYFNQVPMNAPKVTNNEKDYSKLPNNCAFTMKKFQTNRKFSNLFGPEISVVKKRVEFFIKNKKWYDVKGIPYTLGLLLSGQAGAGKTSSVKCLANETQRHIININLNNDITKTQMENLFYNEEICVINVSTGQTEKYCIPLDQRIYVLEDIDCQSDLVMERELKNKIEEKTDDISNITNIKTNPNKPDTNSNNNKSNNTSNIICSQKLDLSFLLNLLDGVLEIPGRIVIMTSNYIKMLDHALIRPGRIDVIADFKKCLNQTLIEMIEFFYDIKITNEDRKRINSLHEFLVSPAEMGKLMFENIDNYLNVIDILENNPLLEKVEQNVVEINNPLLENPLLEKVEQNVVEINNPLLENPLLEKVEQNVVENNPLLKKVEQKKPILSKLRADQKQPILKEEQNNPLLEKVEQNVVENNQRLKKEELSVEEKFQRIQEAERINIENNPPEYSKLYDKATFISSYSSEKVQSVEGFTDDINRMSYCVY